MILDTLKTDFMVSIVDMHKLGLIDGPYQLIKEPDNPALELNKLKSRMFNNSYKFKMINSWFTPFSIIVSGVDYVGDTFQFNCTDLKGRVEKGFILTKKDNNG